MPAVLQTEGALTLKTRYSIIILDIVSHLQLCSTVQRDKAAELTEGSLKNIEA